MKSTRMRLVEVATALSVIAIAAPVATAGAAPITIVSSGPTGCPQVTLPTQTGSVTGPTYVTTGSDTFTGTHIVVTSGAASVRG